MAEADSEDEPVILAPILVTATKIAIPLEESAASATVIDAKTIEEKQFRTVAEALRTVPGLNIVQTGGPGGSTSVFIRGGNSSHTLVLIDGVQVNSPTLGQYNFANLTTDNVERIEIIRGPQSTLYGADALAGVIQIFTKKGRGPASASFLIEGGSLDSRRAVAQLNGVSKQMDYAFSASRFDRKGFSKAEVGTERDGYENTSFSSRLGYQFSKTVRLDWTARYGDAHSDSDASFPISDNLATQKTVASSSALTLSGELLPGWQHKIQYSFQQEDLTGEDVVPGFNNFEIDTRGQQVEWQQDLELGRYNHLTFGIEYEELNGKNKSASGFDKSLRNIGIYALNQFRFSPVIFNLGLRSDESSEFGETTTYKTELAYLHDETGSKIRAAYGTGFHAPTLNDLYFPGFGNNELKPEESKSFELGIDQQLVGKALQVTATYFHSKVDNLIVFVFDPTTFVGQPENVQKATTDGWELGMTWLISKKISFAVDYTRTNTRNKSTGAELARRPKQKGSGRLSIKPTEKLFMSLDVLYVGKRFNDTANSTRMSDYTLVNLVSRYDLSRDLQLFTRIDNLFARDYQEVAGFGTAGFSVFAGLKFSF